MTIEVGFPLEEDAHFIAKTMSVDKDIRPDKSKVTITNEGPKLKL